MPSLESSGYNDESSLPISNMQLQSVEPKLPQYLANSYQPPTFEERELPVVHSSSQLMSGGADERPIRGMGQSFGQGGLGQNGLGEESKEANPYYFAQSPGQEKMDMY